MNGKLISKLIKDISSIFLCLLGLTNAPVTFQHFISDVQWDFLDKFVISHLDDSLMFSEDPDQQLSHVQVVLKKGWSNISFSQNCVFDQITTKLLGYILYPEGLKMVPWKGIQEWKVPWNMKEL